MTCLRTPAAITGVSSRNRPHGSTVPLIETQVPARRLHAGLARDRAVDLLLVSTAFAAWDELLTVRGRSPAAATATVVDLAIRAVVSGH